MGQFIAVERNVRVYVEDINPDGRETVLFIHGWPANRNMFEYQYNELCQQGYRCIGVDTRGFGKSDRPFAGYDYDRLADDVRCVIEALNLREITLAGHSTGGAIAIRYMARHAEHGVAKLALFAAAAPSLIQRRNFPYGLKREAVLKMIADILEDRPQMLRNFGDQFFFQKITQAFSDWFFQMGLEAAGWATAAVAQTWLDETQLFADLAAISTPTLILHGIHDQVVHFELGEAQQQGIDQAKLVPFCYSGHGLFYDEKEKFNRELLHFLAGNDCC